MFGESPWLRKLRVVFWVVTAAGLGLIILVLVRGQPLIIRSPEAYQAVFLDNDQVYFGKLRPAGRDFLSLTDIYYLRAGSLQKPDESAESAVDLIKLGAELHAPKDEMIINRQHVIFYEDLSAGGEIMKLIRQHKAGK